MPATCETGHKQDIDLIPRPLLESEVLAQIEQKVGNTLEETMITKGVIVTNQQGQSGCCTVF